MHDSNGGCRVAAMFLTSILIISALVCAPKSFGEAGGSTERVRVSLESLDLGSVFRGAIAHGAIAIENLTDEFLPIESIGQSCGCTSLLSSYEGIVANRKVTLELDVDTALKPEGRHVQYVSLLFGEGKGSKVLETSVDVVDPGPETIDFGEIRTDRPRIGSQFSVKGIDGNVPKIVSVDYNEAFFDVTVRKPRFWNRLEYPVVQIVYKEVLPSGTFDELLKLTTDRPGHEVHRVAVVGNVLGDYVFSPSALSLGVLTNDYSSTYGFDIYSPYGEQFAIRNIESTSEGQFRFEFDAATLATRHHINVSLEQPFSRGAIKNEILIGVTGGKIVRMPVFGFQR